MENKYKKEFIKAMILNNEFIRAKLNVILVVCEIDPTDKQLSEFIDNQIEKGIEKYGQTIIDCQHESYNWDSMMLEEIVDLFCYFLKKEKVF
jgi:hypothetical protein